MPDKRKRTTRVTVACALGLAVVIITAISIVLEVRHAHVDLVAPGDPVPGQTSMAGAARGRVLIGAAARATNERRPERLATLDKDETITVAARSRMNVIPRDEPPDQEPLAPAREADVIEIKLPLGSIFGSLSEDVVNQWNELHAAGKLPRALTADDVENLDAYPLGLGRMMVLAIIDVTLDGEAFPVEMVTAFPPAEVVRRYVDQGFPEDETNPLNAWFTPSQNPAEDDVQ